MKLLPFQRIKTKNVEKWLKIILYQVSFTSVLTVYFGLVLFLYLATLDNFSPRVRFRKSQIAIAVRPLPKDPYSSLIEFTPGYSGTWKHHKDSIKNFLSPYGHGKYAGTSVKCKWNHVLDKTNWCHVSRRRLIDWTHDVHCSKSENYGYTMGQPCIYLRPTKVFDWEPEPYYNLTEAFSHPTMPKFIKDKINATWIKFCQGKGDQIEAKCPQLRMVWLSCEGETAADTEYMGPVTFTPKKYQGFPGFYFPYVNQNHYLSPLMTMQFRNLEPGVLVSIVCKLWAKNIRHDPFDHFVGGTRFELRMN